MHPPSPRPHLPPRHPFAQNATLSALSNTTIGQQQKQQPSRVAAKPSSSFLPQAHPPPLKNVPLPASSVLLHVPRLSGAWFRARGGGGDETMKRANGSKSSLGHSSSTYTVVDDDATTTLLSFESPKNLPWMIGNHTAAPRRGEGETRIASAASVCSPLSLESLSQLHLNTALHARSLGESVISMRAQLDTIASAQQESTRELREFITQSTSRIEESQQFILGLQDQLMQQSRNDSMRHEQWNEISASMEASVATMSVRMVELEAHQQERDKQYLLEVDQLKQKYDHEVQEIREGVKQHQFEEQKRRAELEAKRISGLVPLVSTISNLVPTKTEEEKNQAISKSKSTVEEEKKMEIEQEATIIPLNQLAPPNEEVDEDEVMQESIKEVVEMKSEGAVSELIVAATAESIKGRLCERPIPGLPPQLQPQQPQPVQTPSLPLTSQPPNVPVRLNPRYIPPIVPQRLLQADRQLFDSISCISKPLTNALKSLDAQPTSKPAQPHRAPTLFKQHQPPRLFSPLPMRLSQPTASLAKASITVEPPQIASPEAAESSSEEKEEKTKEEMNESNSSKQVSQPKRHPPKQKVQPKQKVPNLPKVKPPPKPKAKAKSKPKEKSHSKAKPKVKAPQRKKRRCLAQINEYSSEEESDYSSDDYTDEEEGDEEVEAEDEVDQANQEEEKKVEEGDREVASVVPPQLEVATALNKLVSTGEAHRAILTIDDEEDEVSSTPPAASQDERMHGVTDMTRDDATSWLTQYPPLTSTNQPAIDRLATMSQSSQQSTLNAHSMTPPSSSSAPTPPPLPEAPRKRARTVKPPQIFSFTQPTIEDEPIDFPTFDNPFDTGDQRILRGRKKKVNYSQAD